MSVVATLVAVVAVSVWLYAQRVNRLKDDVLRIERSRMPVNPSSFPDAYAVLNIFRCVC